jgi:hypothetical protein
MTCSAKPKVHGCSDQSIFSWSVRIILRENIVVGGQFLDHKDDDIRLFRGIVFQLFIKNFPKTWRMIMLNAHHYTKTSMPMILTKPSRHVINSGDAMRKMALPHIPCLNQVSHQKQMRKQTYLLDILYIVKHPLCPISKKNKNCNSYIHRP